MTFQESVCFWVRQVPPGRATTYGQVALLCGRPRAARAVGTALSRGPAGVPCHRVVNARGETAPSWPRQQKLLEQEGVPLLPDGRVDLARCFWPGSEDHLMVDNQMEVEF